jgi:hypothetical protein
MNHHKMQDTQFECNVCNRLHSTDYKHQRTFLYLPWNIDTQAKIVQDKNYFLKQNFLHKVNKQYYKNRYSIKL